MPKAALRPCRYPGCSELVESGYCEVHAERWAEMHSAQQSRWPTRDPKVQRLYGRRRWEQMRRRQLSKHPWCEICLRDGIYIQATDVHHIVRHEGDEYKFYNSSLQSLCHSCHSKITATEVRGRGAEKV